MCDREVAHPTAVPSAKDTVQTVEVFVKMVVLYGALVGLVVNQNDLSIQNKVKMKTMELLLRRVERINEEPFALEMVANALFAIGKTLKMKQKNATVVNLVRLEALETGLLVESTAMTKTTTMRTKIQESSNKRMEVSKDAVDSQPKKQRRDYVLTSPHRLKKMT